MFEMYFYNAFTVYVALLLYGDGAGNTVEEN